MNTPQPPPIAVVIGASSGIGEAIAAQFVKRGSKVIGTSRNAPRQALTGQSNVEMTQLDVREDTSVEAFSNRLLSAGLIPDIIIINAGIGIAGPIEETTIDQATLQFETNFFGAHRTVRALLPAMRLRGNGRIIFIGSIASKFAVPFQAFYAASKAALDSYAAALRMEVMAFGINVSIVDPGDHNTGFASARQKTKARAHSDYEPQVSRALAIMEKNEHDGASPESLAKFILRVSETARPRLRYMKINSSERILKTISTFCSPEAFQLFCMVYFKIPSRKAGLRENKTH